MTEQIETLVVVADGGGARAFEEPRRHGPLKERIDWRMRPNPADRQLAYTHGGTASERMGSGRHNVLDAPPTEAAETHFLREVAERLNRAAAADGFAHLVLIAPPKALGAQTPRPRRAASHRTHRRPRPPGRGRGDPATKPASAAHSDAL